MKKAFTWLEQNDVEYVFIDYKKDGVIAAHIVDWLKQVGWETLLNRRGLTWKKLTEAERTNINQAKAVELMQAYPSLVKRPVLAVDKKVFVGFSSETYQVNLSEESSDLKKIK